MDDNLRRWLPWIIAGVVAIIIVIVIIVVANGGDDEAGATSTTAGQTTTTAAETTTTAAETTTTAAETTTTTAPAGSEVAETPIVAELQPYNDQGADLFPPGSVQAHWYQWNGLYVVLYRGFDASGGMPICAGNSIQEASGFNYVSDSPFGAAVADICDGVPKVAEAPSGVYSCGALLYYLTEIPTDTIGNLYGTLEIVQDGASVVYGQTSAVTGQIDATPEFEPGLTAYELPPSTVDDLTSVSCAG